MTIHAVGTWKSHTLPAMFLAFVSVAGLSGCPETEDSGDHDARPIVTKNPVSADVQDTIVLVAGETTRVPVDIGYRGAEPSELAAAERVMYSAQPRQEFYPLGDDGERRQTYDDVNSAFTISFDTSMRSEANKFVAEMQVAAASGVAPGIYRFEILTLTVVTPSGTSMPIANEKAPIAIVVLPTGDSISSQRVTAVALGATHALAVTVDGEVYAWGENQRGQLGDGTIIDRATPVRVVDLPNSSANRVVSVAAGGNVSAAWMQDGTVWMWGDNADSQIVQFNDNLAVDREHRECSTAGRFRDWFCFPRPRLILDTYNHDNVGVVARAIPAFGELHGLMVRSDGTVLAAGDNTNAQTHPTTLANYAVVPGVPTHAVQVAASKGASLALLSDGSVWGWGRAEGLALGVSVGLLQRTPTDIPFLSQVTAISAGDGFAIALRNDRTLRTWGVNGDGQLGFGDTTSVNVANHIVMSTLSDPFTAVKIAAGRAHSLALSTDGGLYAWGENEYGQVGNGNAPTDRLSPQLILSLAGITAIAAGGNQSVAAFGSCGQVVSWGQNISGQLGHSDNSMSRDRPLTVYGLGEVGVSSGCNVMLRVFPDGPGTIAFTGGTIAIGSCSEPASYCAAEIGGGGTIAVTATPASGSRFERWAGDCGGTNASLTLAMNHSKNCIALFRKVTPTLPEPPIPVVTANLTVSVVGGGSIASNVVGTADGIACPSNCSESYVAGSVVALTASPLAGFSFSAWNGTGCTASTATISVTMDVARTCSASFISSSLQWLLEGAGLNVTAPTTPASIATPEIEMGVDGQPIAAFVEGSTVGGVETRALIVRRWDNPSSSWVTMGAPLGAKVGSSSLTIDSGGAPVVAWDTTLSNGTRNVLAARWNGTDWILLGGEPVDLQTTADAHSPSIRARSGDIVLAWAESSDLGGSRIVVRRWSSGAWSNVGTSQGPAHPSSFPESDLPRLAVGAGDELAVAWSENFLSVRAAELIGGVWTTTATPPLPTATSGAGYMLDLAFSSSEGLLFVAQQNNGGTFFVRRWRSGTWSDLGTARSSDVAGGPRIFGLSFSHGRTGATPLLAYSRRNSSGSIDEFIVERFTGTNWARVGNALPTLDRHGRPGFEFSVAVVDGPIPRLATHVISALIGSSSRDDSIVVYRFQ